MNLIKKMDDMESTTGRMMHFKGFSESSKEVQNYIYAAAVGCS